MCKWCSDDILVSIRQNKQSISFLVHQKSIARILNIRQSPLIGIYILPCRKKVYTDLPSSVRLSFRPFVNHSVRLSVLPFVIHNGTFIVSWFCCLSSFWSATYSHIPDLSTSCYRDYICPALCKHFVAFFHLYFIDG